MHEAATSSLATIAEADQPIVIEDDDDAQRTGASASSVAATTFCSGDIADQEEFHVEGTSNC